MELRQLDLDETSPTSFFTNIWRYRGTVLTGLRMPMACSVLLSASVAVAHDLSRLQGFDSTLEGVLGAFIFTLVVFRHNISHARYNEARALLSNIKNGLRGIMVLVAGCGIEVASGPRAVAYKAEVRELAKHLQVLFTTVVMDVRDSRVPADDGPGAPPEVMERRSQRTQIEAVRSLEQRVLVARKLSDQKDMYAGLPASMRPVMASLVVSQLLHELYARRDGTKHFIDFNTLQHCQRLLHEDAMRGWENAVRIVTCPTPFVYLHLMWLLAFIYVYTFPFAFVGLLGYVTIPASMFICLGLYGLLLSAQELDNPLWRDLNDIDLDGFRDLVGVDIDGVFSYKFNEPVVPSTQPPTARNSPVHPATRQSPSQATVQGLGVPPSLTTQTVPGRPAQQPLFTRPKPAGNVPLASLSRDLDSTEAVQAFSFPLNRIGERSLMSGTLSVSETE